MIRANKLQMFVPFVNKDYRNNWSPFFHLAPMFDNMNDYYRQVWWLLLFVSHPDLLVFVLVVLKDCIIKLCKLSSFHLSSLFTYSFSFPFSSFSSLFLFFFLATTEAEVLSKRKDFGRCGDVVGQWKYSRQRSARRRESSLSPEIVCFWGTENTFWLRS